MAGIGRRERLVAYGDPLVHALVAAAVVAPLVRRAGSAPLLTAVAAGTLIDVDHPVAARSLDLRENLSLASRPRSHSFVAALATGVVGGAAGGPMHAWAAFAGLASHLLRDAGDGNAPTPLLWPFAPARQLGRVPALGGIAGLAAGSWLLSRAAGAAASRSAAGADDGAAGALRQTG
jgi:hypothetical protein